MSKSTVGNADTDEEEHPWPHVGSMSVLQKVQQLHHAVSSVSTKTNGHFSFQRHAEPGGKYKGLEIMLHVLNLFFVILLILFFIEVLEFSWIILI